MVQLLISSTIPPLLPKSNTQTKRSKPRTVFREKFVAPGHLPPVPLSPGPLSPGYLSPRHLSPGYLSPGHLSPGYLSPGYLSAGYLWSGHKSQDKCLCIDNVYFWSTICKFHNWTICTVFAGWLFNTFPVRFINLLHVWKLHFSQCENMSQLLSHSWLLVSSSGISN